MTDFAWSLGRTIKGVFGGDFPELKKTVEDAKAKRDMLERTANVAFQEAALGTLKGLHENSQISGDVLEAINAVVIPDIKGIQTEQVRNRQRQEKEDLEKSRSEILEWLQKGTSAALQVPDTQYRANLDKIHPGTGKRIIETQELKTWRDQKKPSLLYLFGSGGFGKSFLASVVIESLKNQPLGQDRNTPQLVYFFCKAGDNATQQGIKIMLHLVAQLFFNTTADIQRSSDQFSGKRPKVERLIEVLENARKRLKNTEEKRDSSLLQINSALQPIFVDLADVVDTRVFVIVDAVDECNDKNAALLHALKALPDSGTDIRVLVTSRPESKVSYQLGDIGSIEVNRSKNHADILAYVSDSLKDKKSFRHLDAGPAIAEKSNGMFRCK